MLGHYTDGYNYRVWKIAEMQFPAGVVALDIDAPTKDYAQFYLRDTMYKRVVNLVSGLSARFALGRFWIYSTGSPGAHVIFENPVEDWLEVLHYANGRIGWHECTGHYTTCKGSNVIKLRVGHKPGRSWDIVAWDTNPANDKPAHIVEHENLLKLQLQAEAI